MFLNYDSVHCRNVHFHQRSKISLLAAPVSSFSRPVRNPPNVPSIHSEIATLYKKDLSGSFQRMLHVCLSKGKRGIPHQRHRKRNRGIPRA